MPQPSRPGRSAVLLLAGFLALSACEGGAAARADDDRLWLIAADGPGEITRATTEADLIRRFGEANVRREEIELGEGDSSPGAVLFPGDSTRRLEVVWKNPQARSGVELARAIGTSSRWTVAPEITLGTSLADLERLNGGPFAITLYEHEPGGMISSWRGGRLSRLDSAGAIVQIWLAPAADTTTFGLAPAEPGEPWPELASDSPHARRAGMTVREITLWYPDQEMADQAPRADSGRFPVDRLPARAAQEDAFVPGGWKVATRVEGDLTRDGTPDAVLHLVPQASEYEAGAITAAPEASALLVLVRDSAGGFRRAGVATHLLQTIVPQWGLDLQLSDTALVVNQNYGMTEVMDLTHHFRHDPASGRFWLARKESFFYTRPLSRYDTERSVEDYVAGERVRTTGEVRDGVVVRERSARETIPRARVFMEDVREVTPEEPGS